MGCSPSFPREYRPIAYEPQCRFTDTGRYVDSRRTVNSQTSFFHHLYTQFWGQFISERKRRHEAKAKFKDVNTRELFKEFPMWSQQELHNFKLRFQVLDINADGLLDEHEINQVLDEYGDPSTKEERRIHLREVASDGSDSIDFTQFLQVLQLIQSGNMADNTGLGALCVRDIEDKAKCVQRLTVLEQMEAGVF